MSRKGIAWGAVIFLLAIPLVIYPGLILAGFQFQFLSLIFSGSQLQEVTEGAEASFSLETRKLDTLKEGLVVRGCQASGSDSRRRASNFVFSKSGEHVAYTICSRAGQQNVVNGVEEPLYFTVTAVEFSENGKTYGYAHCTETSPRTEECSFTLNGNVIDSAGRGNAEKLAISPNGNHVAYVYNSGGLYVVSGGVSGKKYSNIREINVRDDGTVIYVAFDADGGSHVVVNNEEFGDARSAYDPISSKIASVVGDRGNFRVSFNGTEGKSHNLIGGLTISPGGNRIAYIADEQGANDFVVVDGVEGPKDSGQTIEAGPVFSPDGENVAYIVSGTFGSKLIVNDESKSIRGTYFRDLVFSADSEHVGYHANKVYFGDPFSVSRRNVSIDDMRGTSEYDDIYDFAISNDGSLIGYGARKENDLWWVVEQLAE